MDADAVETERLLLRSWRRDDVDALSRVFAKPEVWHFPFGRGWTADETSAFLDRKLDEWATRGWSQWAVIDKSSDVLIGFLGLNPPGFLPEVMPTVEVGWRIDPEYWGRGLATEGGRAALRFGFEDLGLDEIVSIYEPANVASGRVMERLGMTHDRDTVHPERGIPLRVYKLLREDWADHSSS
ncbi:MAG TPA: GNAT family N-acetyltransferase [Acidimicrobiales bacterium]|nr:GNAT family N-acetyltransferase [Acidimicrobiales bacterium]